MVSPVTEGHIKKLRKAGYLSKDIAHRLPEKGQLLPTPRPHEKVVFLPHFLHGLGFPLHPFVRGLMFYYGLDFHDLAPNFVLNISAFIIVCEAFLRIRPHFGLWLGPDAEEGLAHDDKRRDVEDEIRGLITEIQAVVEHEPPDKGVEWEAQSAEEMGEEHHPLMGPRGGDELPLFGEPVRDVVRQVSGLPQLFDVSLHDGGDHPLASRSVHGWRRLRWGVRTWALELECARMDRRRRKKA